ncbi:uncharacterized protein LOC111948487 isoform X1 [Oryzias latipes]|uniref:uncharacterized protein LOC111948487 isoform X1 n=1 Tax=Oryzias latipes TaxID=8090 RepID=UPI000CE19AD8|nr:uncharacterized protein LOC111948487 isoform X1 [Oryzias latipes]XP_023817615.1 uncharacterized protein LOC111948487 isoform X1 [Oryzias latipes]XP_023817616.1 uncharacterized protein LOC111948487 isoform X1 [Oryzias latipes]XP_023817617.1 uncharacterized protein LOC111948487 isoform X1 [Oryzias latipes]XP_023817618.1 uncharacterized protein LOC111948487 isoform X1 [Oryzias latipes]
MRLICFVCRVHFVNVNNLVRHMRLIHGFYSGKALRLKCAQPGCCHVFGTFSGFRKHLLTKHCEQTEPEEESVDTVDSDVRNDSQLAINENTASISQVVPVSDRSTLDLCASAIAQLQVAGVAQSTLNGFVSSMEEVVMDIQSQAKATALKCLAPQDKRLKIKVEKSFEKLENPFTSFNSETKRSNYFQQKWKTVEPVEKVLGVRLENRRNRSSGTYKQVIVTDKFAYVPILETLQSIIRNPNFAHMLTSSHLSKDGVYFDIQDGLYVKSHPLFSKKDFAFLIQLFYDEFETANPLGSKKGIHKLGGIYFTLRNFPPKLNSSLVNIHLCALFHAQDIKTYGFNTILEPIISDLKVLETCGITSPMFQSPVRGSIVQVTGDNLGLHGIFGFVESFSAHYCCRFCVTEKSEFQSVFCENESIIVRTKDMHAEHCCTLQTNPQLPHFYGVKRSSLLNTLQFFDTADNLSVDVMHDILEGVAQFEVKLILEYVQQNFLTAKELSGRTESFNYGHTERRNRPPAVKLFDGSNDLGLNAIQSWCLLRNMPLIFGDLVQKGNEYWHLLLLLLQIVGIVFAPVITDGMTIFLKHLIVEHHQLFKHLFPSRNLLPKHHFMIHYPRCIRNIGPILHMWSMRYEAKHNFFKTQLKSFKNITKTLAKRHQRYMALHWEAFSHFRLMVGPGKMFWLQDLKEGPEIADKLNTAISTNVLSVKWVKHNGTEYKPGLIVCVEVANEMPVFYKIHTIFVKDEQVVLALSGVETVCFDEHYHAFKILLKPFQIVTVLNIQDLFYYKPMDVQMTYGPSDTSMYVVPYCHLMQV